MKTKIFVLFVLTLFLSFFIRFYHLTKNPEGFDQTEAAFCYNAFSILNSGHDEYGKRFPLVLTSIGDHKLKATQDRLFVAQLDLTMNFSGA